MFRIDKFAALWMYFGTRMIKRTFNVLQEDVICTINICILFNRCSFYESSSSVEWHPASIFSMVLILAGNSEHLAHSQKMGLFVENKICDCSQSNQKTLTDQITEIAQYVRTHFWITIEYKYHDRQWCTAKCPYLDSNALLGRVGFRPSAQTQWHSNKKILLLHIHICTF